MEYEADMDTIMDIEDALEEYLTNKYTKIGSEEKVMLSAIQMGKSFSMDQAIYEMSTRTDNIVGIVRKFPRMSVEEWPLYINDDDPIVADAVTWLLKNAVRRDYE